MKLYEQNKVNDVDPSMPTEITLSDGTNFTFDKMIYTGPIDEYFNYLYGHLEYRSVRFETEEIDCDNFQGNAVVNYTEREVPSEKMRMVNLLEELSSQRNTQVPGSWVMNLITR